MTTLSTSAADHYPTEKLHVFGRYSCVNFKINSPGILRIAGGPGFDPSGGTSAFAGTSASRNHSIAGGFDYTLRPNLFTDFRFGYFRYKVYVVPNGLGTIPRKGRGIPGLNLDKTSPAACPPSSSTITATICSSSATRWA